MNEIDPILLLEYHKELNERSKFGSSVKGAVKGAVGGAVRGLLGPVVGAVGGAISGARNAAHNYDQEHQKRSKAAKKGWRNRKSHGRMPMKSTREGIDQVLFDMYNKELNEGVGWGRSNHRSFSTNWTNASMICDLLDQLQEGVGEDFSNYMDHPNEVLPESLAKKVHNLLVNNKSKIGMESISTDPLGRTIKGGMDKFTISGGGELPGWASKEINEVIKFCGPPYTNNEDTMMLNVGSEPVQGFGFEQKIDVKEKSDGTFSIIVQEDGQEIEVDTAQTGDEAKELAREYSKMFSSGPFLEEPNFSK